MNARMFSRRLMFALLASTGALMLAACTTDEHGASSEGTLQQGAGSNPDCTDTSVACARKFISRASDCAQLVNMAGQQPVALRQCAVSNYEAALTHTPADGTDSAIETRRDALAGLADALKQQRDNAATPAESSARQQDLDKVADELARTPGGTLYAKYFRADSLVIASLNPALAQADACASLCKAAVTLPANAAAALPASGVDGDLKLRVNRLLSAITQYQSQRSCSTCPTS